MKILQLSKYYPPTFGGLEIVAEFFSRAAIDLGHEVKVLSVGKETKHYRGKYGEQVFQCREEIKLNSSPLSLQFYLKFSQLLKTETPDLIFVHLPNPFSHELLKIFSSIIKENKIRVVGIYHSDIINQVTLRDAYNLYFRNSIHLYDNFICSSPNLKETSSILSHLNHEVVKIIPFCIDNPGQVRPRKNEFKGKFLTIGRMVPYKGFEFLIEAFSTLPYELTVVGEGPLWDSLTSKAGPNVKFLGSVSEEEKYNLFADHDALIMSSINRAEAFGMTIVEAFSAGLPVIASDIDTGVSFLVRDGETGLKFAIKNQSQLHLQIERLMKNSELAENLSRRSTDFFHSHLSYQAFRKNLDQFFAGVSSR